LLKAVTAVFRGFFVLFSKDTEMHYEALGKKRMEEASQRMYLLAYN